ncbi:MAG TPA: hypothetical protein VL404_00795 [Candidatus Eisenbacteria bacterium]|jgi:hypothetical protein|nr:hypothetical protein [Candidatus Eisenbacteria bacterium]
MTFDELLVQIESKECQEKRDRETDYLEVVVTRALLESFAALLAAYFGPPFKPEGEKPSAEALRHAEPYGGIYAGQTMYFRRGEEGPELALLWPWGSQPMVTLKIIRGAEPA